MMPAAGSASLKALTIWRCQHRGTWTLCTPQHGQGGGAATSLWWGRVPWRDSSSLWRVTPPPPHFHISLHTAERQSPSQMFYFELFKFWPAFSCFCLWRRRKRWRGFNQQKQHRCQLSWKDAGVDYCTFCPHSQLILIWEQTDKMQRNLTLFNLSVCPDVYGEVFPHAYKHLIPQSYSQKLFDKCVCSLMLYYFN